MLSSNEKHFENRLRSDKVTVSLKVGTFLRHREEIRKGDSIVWVLWARQR